VSDKAARVRPKPDGSIPEETVAILQAVGKWTGPNATAIYGTEPSNFHEHVYANFDVSDDIMAQVDA
jgi:alpha-L-fucosidase